MNLLNWIKSLFSSKKQNNLPLDNPSFNEIKRRIKIVVIDDDPDSFPTDLFKNDGYSIDSLQQIDSQILQRLENSAWDIIVLDIQGVVDAKITIDEGLGILRRIKKISPNQIVIAFSGQSYDLGKMEFFKLADDTINKPVTYLQAKEKIDKIISEKISIDNFIKTIRCLLEKEGLNSGEIIEIEKKLRLKNSELSPSKLLSEVKSQIVEKVKNPETILALVERMYSLWKS